MGLKVLVLPDKFKGTLTAAEAADAIARGWLQARPNDVLELLPMSDGGDGFGEVTSASLNAQVKRVKTVNAAHRPCTAKWWWQANDHIAIIESATVIGLAMLPPGKFHPFELDTFGLGALLQAAVAIGARQCLIGIGGSATNDGGFGLARALGWQFLDAKDAQIKNWTELDKLKNISPPKRPGKLGQGKNSLEIRVAVDVQNPLLGADGASRVYGPQKGLKEADFEKAESSLGKLALVVKGYLGHDVSRKPGTGAAGGLGFGLVAFCSARLEPGFDLFAGLAHLEEQMRRADLVITGEGKIDHSTLMGKGVGQIAQRCGELKKPCIALGGVVEPETRKRQVFAKVQGLTELTTLEQATRNPGVWLEHLSQQVANSWWA